MFFVSLRILQPKLARLVIPKRFFFASLRNLQPKPARLEPKAILFASLRNLEPARASQGLLPGTRNPHGFRGTGNPVQGRPALIFDRASLPQIAKQESGTLLHKLLLTNSGPEGRDPNRQVAWGKSFPIRVCVCLV